MGGDDVRTPLEQEAGDRGDDARAVGAADQQPGGVGRRVRCGLAIARGTVISRGSGHGATRAISSWSTSSVVAVAPVDASVQVPLGLVLTVNVCPLRRGVVCSVPLGFFFSAVEFGLQPRSLRGRREADRLCRREVADAVFLAL